MIATSDIYELIEEHRKKLGLSQAEVALRAFGQDSSAAIQGLRRGKSPGIERLSAMSDVLGLELYFGPPRANAEINHPYPSTKENAAAPIEDFAFVDRFDVKLSAGPGTNGENACILAPVAFRRAWMSERGLHADRCVVCNVGGNSMEPLLYEGDLVLLDRHGKVLRNGYIYGIVDIEGDVRIKRIERVEQGIVLRSENPDCPSELRLGEDANRVSIIGALVWSGHSYDAMRRLPNRSDEPVTFEHKWI